MKILELFSGTESFSKVARERGHETFTVDNNEKFKPDLCIDIFDLKINQIPFSPDFIWASPPCTHFSIATHRHWRGKIPSKETQESIKLIAKTLEIIFSFVPRFWILENPKGRLRWVLGYPGTTVYYGSYGHPVLKPTDFWGFYPRLKFKPKPLENLGDWSYDIQRDAKNRAVVPKELCKEILIACENERRN